MSDDPPLAVSCLRDIGWREWDPIGLLAAGEAWSHKPFADEYDTYLLTAARDLRQGAPHRQIIDYLLMIERDYIGLGTRIGQEERAEATVRALKTYVTRLDGTER